ncbi:tRNA adenosine(34) deaminase TadA [Fructobacillus evanidus]|uniref:tRNA-specific adenosine deaminase n=1 Tax=Fructobacillus evanidus TaxID=3064281 RepID=A0ABM9MS06_9LACO|nr:tRNA(Arg) A34 adenosine deaminase TadA (TadA) [Fructobacillus sp. LMG 32999]CAK1235100.1 tRNA(Arg) A34 adenosine deaminase TadA (TadA) [Fructobacillus sp. LMG 32999]CAK1235504.1 tRNA(Arg) A34 adenosine deaminase TadA (TadA) [Fructobacillus sp. LMG 32999]CAK1235552.1 tRNA(Arg) A34 adenosine deaminase TadA (TadA) [Fructobacillus sp. LMG 32999]CAK1238197.1 tRNA(Arg) A34 adenosine deaminase TadA (TadA) [Fructobacillus sp. LMG 32999]
MAEIPTLSSDQVAYFMDIALAEAKRAGEIGEVPIGAVIVKDGQVIATGSNRREIDQEASSHAELLAINQANQELGTWRLENTALFVTLEPCLMCAGAIINARIPLVYYGAQDQKAGAVSSLYNVFEDERLNHQVKTYVGVKADQSKALLKDFFQEIRQKQKAKKRAAKELKKLTESE